MQLTIEIPEQMLRDVVMSVLGDAFKAPQYSHQRGQGGYEAIRSQVNQFVDELDCRELIRKHASQQLDTIVRDVVRLEVAKRVKEMAKEEAKAGTLFRNDE